MNEISALDVIKSEHMNTSTFIAFWLFESLNSQILLTPPIAVGKNYSMQMGYRAASHRGLQ